MEGSLLRHEERCAEDDGVKEGSASSDQRRRDIESGRKDFDDRFVRGDLSEAEGPENRDGFLSVNEEEESVGIPGIESEVCGSRSDIHEGREMWGRLGRRCKGRECR